MHVTCESLVKIIKVVPQLVRSSNLFEISIILLSDQYATITDNISDICQYSQFKILIYYFLFAGADHENPRVLDHIVHLLIYLITNFAVHKFNHLEPHAQNLGSDPDLLIFPLCPIRSKINIYIFQRLLLSFKLFLSATFD